MITREEAAKLFWEEDGPTYTGWPNTGERVHWEYRNQYPRERDRCFRIADAILKVLKADRD